MKPSYEALLEFWDAHRAVLDAVGGLLAGHGRCDPGDDVCLEAPRRSYGDALARQRRAEEAIEAELQG